VTSTPYHISDPINSQCGKTESIHWKCLKGLAACSSVLIGICTRSLVNVPLHHMTLSLVRLPDFGQYQCAVDKASHCSNRYTTAHSFSGIPPPHTHHSGFQSCEANVVSLRYNKGFVQEVCSGQQVGVLLDQTCFYAEQGGQIFDEGFITKMGDEVNGERGKGV